MYLEFTPGTLADLGVPLAEIPLRIKGVTVREYHTVDRMSIS
jgi:hypothetical protein